MFEILTSSGETGLGGISIGSRQMVINEIFLLVEHYRSIIRGEVNWLFSATSNGISGINVTAHRCAGGLKKSFDLRSGS